MEFELKKVKSEDDTVLSENNHRKSRFGDSD